MIIVIRSGSLLLAGALALASCAPSQNAAPTMPEPAQSECGAGQLDEFVGATATDALIAHIRQEVGHERIRTIRPGDAVTMDFRADRLNIEIGEDGRIVAVRCG